MGAPRKTGHELPKRVTLYHGAYYYHPKSGARKWLGREFGPAMQEWARLVKAPTSFRTMNDVFDKYELEVIPKKKSEATRADDRRKLPYLRAFCGHMRPEDVDASTGYEYLEIRGTVAPVRANREFALLCHTMTKAVRWKIIRANPLYRLEKNPETPRDREVRPAEVLRWYRFAGPLCGAYSVLKQLIGLRKGDMLRLERAWWTNDGLFSPAQKNGKRTLFERWHRDDAGQLVENRALVRAVSRVFGLRRGGAVYLFETRRQKPYTESGFDSIWQRRMVKFGAAGNERFAEHDLRSKAGDDAEAAGRAGHKLLGNSEAQFRRAYQRRTQRVQPAR